MKILTGDINKDYDILKNFTRYLKELQTKDINYFYAHYLKNYIYINKIIKEVDLYRLSKILYRIDDLCYQEYLLAEINDYKNSEKNNISYNGKVERLKYNRDVFVLKEKYCNDF